MNDESRPEAAIDKTGEVFINRNVAATTAAPVHPVYRGVPTGRQDQRLGYVDFMSETWWSEPDLEVRFSIAADGLTVLIYAARGTGKTLVAVDIVYGLTIRGEVFGEAIDPMRVFYVDRENGGRQLRKRLSAFHGGEFRAEQRALLAERLRYSALGSWKAFNTPDGAQTLLAEVDAFFGDDRGVVIIDSLSKVIAGKENDADTFSQLHAECASLLKARGHIVIQLDNSGKDSSLGARGSSAKEDNVDVVWQLTAVGSPVTHRVLTCKKDREGLFGGEGAQVNLEVDEAPLKHTRSVGPVAATVTRQLDVEARVRRCMDELDRLGVAAAAGTPRARVALKDAGQKFGTDTIAEAVRRRKPDSAGCTTTVGL